MRTAIENLRKNGFEVLVAESLAWALVYGKGMIKKGMSVGFGDSNTVIEIGLLEYLEGLENITLYNQYEIGISETESTYRRRMGVVSDLFITGVDAITRDGKLVNADRVGNRVAAQLYGPRKVAIFAGINKIVDSVEAGIERIESIVAPKNAEKQNERALSFGKKAVFSNQSSMRKLNIINSDEPGRTTIVLISDSVGF